MSVRERYEDAQLLTREGRHTGALLILLVAVAATARKRFPKDKTPSARTPGDTMRDAEAFETFFARAFAETSPIKAFSVIADYRGQPVKLEAIFYKFLRCELAHEGTMPGDIRILLDEPGMIIGSAGNGQPLRLGVGWVDQLAQMVAWAPENTAEFADLLPQLPRPP